MYKVTACDKDGGIYDVLYKSSDYNEVLKVAKVLKTLCDDDRVLSKNREPYDWIEVYTEDGDCVYQF